MHQLEIPAISEARQRLMTELRQELRARLQQKELVAGEIRALKKELREVEKLAGTETQHIGRFELTQGGAPPILLGGGDMMNQLTIPAVLEARQRLIDELHQELSAKDRKKNLLLEETRPLRRELRKELRSAGRRAEPCRPTSTPHKERAGARSQRLVEWAVRNDSIPFLARRPRTGPCDLETVHGSTRFRFTNAAAEIGERS